MNPEEVTAKTAVVKPWFNASSNDGSSCLDTQFYEDGMVAVRSSKDPDGARLMFDAAEWAAFIKGAKSGEFDPLA